MTFGSLMDTKLGPYIDLGFNIRRMEIHYFWRPYAHEAGALHRPRIQGTKGWGYITFGGPMDTKPGPYIDQGLKVQRMEIHNFWWPYGHEAGALYRPRI